MTVRTWTNLGVLPGQWTVPGNWSGSVVPAAADTASITNASTAASAVSLTSTASLASLFIGAGNKLKVGSNGNLTVTSGISIGQIFTSQGSATSTLELSGNLGVVELHEWR